MPIKKLSIGLLLCGISMSLFAESVGEVLWEKLRAINTMKASFTQKIYTKQHELSRSAGDMAFERPHHLRWRTKQPMEQLLIADGDTFWTYDVELEQVTVRSQAALEGAAAGLFLGDDKAQFFHDFKITKIDEAPFQQFKLQAIENQANVQQIILSFEGPLLARMDLYDQLGQRTAIQFKKIQNNVDLSSKLFHFSPPAGVDVVKQ